MSFNLEYLATPRGDKPSYEQMVLKINTYDG